jgi:hypothetical protein
MSTLSAEKAITLELPHEIYEHVRRAARGMKQPVELALAKIVEAATPSLEKVPPEYRAELEALEDLSDQQLLKIAQRMPSAVEQRRLARLLDKNQRGALTEREQQTLAGIRASADQQMLRRSYACLLLKFRGHRIPNLVDVRK